RHADLLLRTRGRRQPALQRRRQGAAPAPRRGQPRRLRGGGGARWLDFRRARPRAAKARGDHAPQGPARARAHARGEKRARPAWPDESGKGALGYLARAAICCARSAIAESSAAPNAGLVFTSCRNVGRLIASSEQSVSAVAVAARGDWSTSAISPKT